MWKRKRQTATTERMDWLPQLWTAFAETHSLNLYLSVLRSPPAKQQQWLGSSGGG